LVGPVRSDPATADEFQDRPARRSSPAPKAGSPDRIARTFVLTVSAVLSVKPVETPLTALVRAARGVESPGAVHILVVTGKNLPATHAASRG
jgi:hypothetical protein